MSSSEFVTNQHRFNLPVFMVVIVHIIAVLVIKTKPKRELLSDIYAAKSFQTRASEGMDVGGHDASRQIGEHFINRWHKRFVNPRGGGYLFLKHTRKAGGTSIHQYLIDVMSYHDKIRQEQQTTLMMGSNFSYDHEILGEVSIYSQEFFAMDWRCPFIDSRWNDTLSIVHLRHPIERHLSEFFYSGPGSRGRLGQLHLEGNYSQEFSSLIRSAMPRWIDEGIQRLHLEGKTGRQFTDNFQTRILSGETDMMPQPYDGPKHNCSKNVLVNGKLVDNHSVCRGCKGGCDCDKPCFYGGKPGGGVYAGHNITEEVQRRAMRVLDKFDLVLISETFDTAEQAAFVSDVMGVPQENASLAQMKKNVRVEKATVGERYAMYQDIMRKTAPELLDLLKKHSEFEMELYRYALKLNRESIMQWRREKKLLAEQPVSNGF